MFRKSGPRREMVAGGDAVVATAILDRLLHHSHVITIEPTASAWRTKRPR
jgi:hypothetical protein